MKSNFAVDEIQTESPRQVVEFCKPGFDPAQSNIKLRIQLVTLLSIKYYALQGVREL